MKTNKRDKEGNREGLWESYYQGGILRSRGYYKNNQTKLSSHHNIN